MAGMEGGVGGPSFDWGTHLDEPMDAFTAVFNGHVNGADRRARDAMARECPGYLAKVLKREKDGNGIMAIFQPPHYKAFERYASLVKLFVNHG